MYSAVSTRPPPLTESFFICPFIEERDDTASYDFISHFDSNFEDEKNWNFEAKFIHDWSLRGAATLSIMTLNIITLNNNTLNNNTLNNNTLNNNTLNNNTLNNNTE
jgi:hypothetical protein